jgi:hypothetical protein
MKKVFATILAVIYLTSSMGATLHLHYCMGKLISWGLASHETKNCSFCGMPIDHRNGHSVMVKDGCCKDEHTQFKTDKDQKPAQTGLEYIKLFPDATGENHLAVTDAFLSSISIDYPTANAPPFIDKVPLFLFNRNFRI